MDLQQAAGALGAWVSGVDISAPLSPSGVTDLRTALAEHGVLFLRDQPVAAPALARFAGALGSLEHHPAYPEVPGAPGVMVLESTAEAPSRIEQWHTDMTFRRQPPVATALLAEVVPAVGGDTLWASTTAAWATLSPAMQAMLAPLQAEHDFRHGFRESLAAPGGAKRLAGAVADHPPVAHPVALEHPVSGALALNVNALFTTRILGLPARESDALLGFLYDHLRHEEHTVRLQWQPGTVALWDNRCTQHKPVNDFHPAHRRMLRAVVNAPATPD